MPKLRQEVIEGKKVVIEDAAKELFIKQGFHATSMRDIAKTAGVSLGNLYNYFQTKDAILESIIGKYQKTIDQKLHDIFVRSDEPLEPENLLAMGQMVKDLVNNHHDFWLLMYIDVLEFQNRHFRKMFEGLTENLRRRFNDYFDDLKFKGYLYEKVDPAVGFTAIYMQFFNYFLVEKLFCGNTHFGLDDDAVIESLTEIFCRGIFSRKKLKRIQAKAATERNKTKSKRATNKGRVK
jgi:AcrR family transcriptional regulator